LCDSVVPEAPKNRIPQLKYILNIGYWKGELMYASIAQDKIQFLP